MACADRGDRVSTPLDPGFGRHPGYDGKAIESHSSGRVAEGKGCASDPDADWGKHETSGVNGKTGAVWKQVKSWFGYGLHLIADTDDEVPVAFEVTRVSVSEARVLPEMLGALFGKAPGMAGRCDDFSADRGLDGSALKARLWDEWTIRPLIDTRLLWQAGKEEPDYDPKRPITRPLFPERADVVVHDERGRVSCVCPETGEERALAFQGFEAGRGACGTLKYRCPAAAFRLRVHGPRGVPAGGRCGARGVRPHPAHRSRHPRPAPLHADAVGQPIVVAGLRAAFCDGADQQPHRPGLRLRDPLHPRPREDEDPYRAGAGGDDGAGPGAGAGRPRRADAHPGRRGAAARHPADASIRLPTSPIDRAGRRQAASRGRPCDHVHILFRACSGTSGFCPPTWTRQTISGRTEAAPCT